MDGRLGVAPEAHRGRAHPLSHPLDACGFVLQCSTAGASGQAVEESNPCFRRLQGVPVVLGVRLAPQATTGACCGWRSPPLSAASRSTPASSPARACSRLRCRRREGRFCVARWRMRGGTGPPSRVRVRMCVQATRRRGSRSRQRASTTRGLSASAPSRPRAATAPAGALTPHPCPPPLRLPFPPRGPCGAIARTHCALPPSSPPTFCARRRDTVRAASPHPTRRCAALRCAAYPCPMRPAHARRMSLETRRAV